MLLAILLLELGALLIYAGVTKRSLRSLMLGDNQTPVEHETRAIQP